MDSVKIQDIHFPMGENWKNYTVPKTTLWKTEDNEKNNLKGSFRF